MSADPTLQPICVIYGKGEFLRREAFNRLAKRELGDGDPAVNLRRFDGVSASCAEVLDEVRTYTLMGGRRVVVVDDADKFISANRERLERFAANPAESGCLILICGAFDARTRFYKAVKKTGEMVDCTPSQGQQLHSWLMSRSRDMHGKRLGHQAATSLREHAGSSQEGLDQELAKLSLYVGPRGEITSEDVEKLVGRYREQTVFAVMDAVADGNAKRALREWHQVLATDRAAAGRAIGGLAWAVRRMLEARARIDAGESLHAVARSVWTVPDVLARRMKRSTARQCEDQLLDLLSADLDSKTGLGHFAGAVEKFIVKHSMAASQR